MASPRLAPSRIAGGVAFSSPQSPVYFFTGSLICTYCIIDGANLPRVLPVVEVLVHENGSCLAGMYLLYDRWHSHLYVRHLSLDNYAAVSMAYCLQVSYLHGSFWSAIMYLCRLSYFLIRSLQARSDRS